MRHLSETADVDQYSIFVSEELELSAEFSIKYEQKRESALTKDVKTPSLSA